MSWTIRIKYEHDMIYSFLRESIKICQVPRWCRSLMAHKSSWMTVHFFPKWRKDKERKTKEWADRVGWKTGSVSSLNVSLALWVSFLTCSYYLLFALSFDVSTSCDCSLSSLQVTHKVLMAEGMLGREEKRWGWMEDRGEKSQGKMKRREIE